MENNNFNSTKYRREEIQSKLDRAGFNPLDVMVTGVTGAGKSNTLNSLFTKNVAEVGVGCDPMTMTLDSYQLHDGLRFWDTPGLGDGIEQDKKHSKKMIELLYKTYAMENKTHGFIDMVIIIVEGLNRDMGTTYQLINDVILANIEPERVVIAINKADIAKKGRGWDNKNNKPLPSLQQFLQEQAASIQSRVEEACGLKVPLPIYYSADNNYNTHVFIDAIISAMPKCRRNLIINRKSN